MISWDDVETKRKEPEYPTFKIAENAKTFRLISSPHPFYKVYDGPRGFITDDPMKIRNCNLKPVQRYAAKVIDRSDNTVKIFEAPAAVFKQILKIHMREQEIKDMFVRPWWQRFLAVFNPKWVEKKWPSPPKYTVPEGECGLELDVWKVGYGPHMRFEVDGWRHIMTEDDQKLADASTYDLKNIFKPTDADEIVKRIEEAKAPAMPPF